MRLRKSQYLQVVTGAGPDARGLDALLLSGPLVIAIIGVMGRTAISVGVAALYLLGFVGYVVYTAATRGRG